MIIKKKRRGDLVIIGVDGRDAGIGRGVNLVSPSVSFSSHLSLNSQSRAEQYWRCVPSSSNGLVSSL